jgi:hypothetical protein
MDDLDAYIASLTAEERAEISRLADEEITEQCVHQDAVKWNPYNHVVQCHRCGHIFVPATPEQYREVKAQLISDGFLNEDGTPAPQLSGD